MVKKIMVVDDSRFIYEELKYFTENSEYEVSIYCKNGEEAVSLYEKEQPDLITMDIILPGMDGLDTSKVLLSKWPDAKIIIVSSLAFEETIDQAKEIGAKGFIFKPFDKEQILKCFRQALD